MKKFMLGIIIILLITLFFLIQKTYFKESILEEMEQEIIVYVQDEELINQTCEATKQTIIRASSEASKYSEILTYLFENELNSYGLYDSYTIIDRELKILLESNMRSDGRPISSLSSCEIEHLQSSLFKTFTQFEEIDSVALYSPQGVVEF